VLDWVCICNFILSAGK